MQLPIQAGLTVYSRIIVRLEGDHYDLMSLMFRDWPTFYETRKSNFAIQFWPQTRFSPWRHCDLISIALMQNSRTERAGGQRYLLFAGRKLDDETLAPAPALADESVWRETIHWTRAGTPGHREAGSSLLRCDLSQWLRGRGTWIISGTH